MAIDTEWLKEVLALAQACEEFAHGMLAIAQRQLKAKQITQEAFDQVYGDYTVAMQKARDMYYQASSGLVQQVTSSAELKAILAETAELNRALATLHKAEKIMTISLTAVSLVGAVTGVIVAPGAASVEAAYAAAKTMKQAITS